MKNIDKYFSLKLINKDNSVKKSKNLYRNEIINEIANEKNEEVKLAEETYSANLKLLKKQKAKFIRLQKILSRNVILIPLCAIFSVLSAVLLFVSTLSDHFELISYDINNLKNKIELENNNSLILINNLINTNISLDQRNEKIIFFQNQNLTKNKSHNKVKKRLSQFSFISYAILEHFQPIYLYNLTYVNKEYFVLIRQNFLLENSTKKINVFYNTYSGIWRLCNFLSDESRKFLNLEKCKFYKTINFEIDLNTDHQDLSEPGRDLIRMHNAAACCTIVSYFLLFFSWMTAIGSVLSKKVPVTLATCVLNLLIAVFIVLLLAIFHRKIITEEKNLGCFDLKNIYNIVCASRTVKFGFGLGITWLALLFTVMNGICWFYITKMQKLLFAHGYFY